MEAPVRIFNPLLNRHLILAKSRTRFKFTHSLKPINRIHQCSISPIFPKHNILKNLTFLSSTNHTSSFRSPNPNDAISSWKRAPINTPTGDFASGSVGGVKEREVTVVILGWLGAKAKHLRRYVEWYNSRGINAVTFTVDVREMIWFDLGRKVEARIEALGKELVAWVSKEEDDGRERCLVFHTFSNTGWLVYGALLDIFKCRQNLMEKIKGCVIDSGGGDPVNPKVWAAGFTAAILKKRSSSVTLDVNGTDSDMRVPRIQEKDPLTVELLLLTLFEKLFSFALNLPDVHQRLKKIVTNLNNESSCPQLYLYSSADKVIPKQTVELHIQEQIKIQNNVSSFDFGSSSHVDHYRMYPHVYSSQLHNFLKVCFAEVKQP